MRAMGSAKLAPSNWRFRTISDDFERFRAIDDIAREFDSCAVFAKDIWE